MRDYSELKARAEASIGFDDIRIAPDVVLELVKNAERYLWLRSRDCSAAPGADKPGYPVIAELSDIYFTDIFTGDAADKAIDDAMKGGDRK